MEKSSFPKAKAFRNGPILFTALHRPAGPSSIAPAPRLQRVAQRQPGPRASSPRTPSFVELLPVCLMTFSPPGPLSSTLSAGPQAGDDASNDVLREDLLVGLLLRQLCQKSHHPKTSTEHKTRTEHPPRWLGSEPARCLTAALEERVFGGVFKTRCSLTLGWF